MGLLVLAGMSEEGAIRRLSSRLSLLALKVCFTWRGPVVGAESSAWTGMN